MISFKKIWQAEESVLVVKNYFINKTLSESHYDYTDRVFLFLSVINECTEGNINTVAIERVGSEERIVEKNHFKTFYRCISPCFSF